MGGMTKLPLPDEQPIAVNALRNKRAELAGLIAMHEREIDRLRSVLIHLDATLLLFDPATDPEDIAPRKRNPKRLHYFGPGEQSRRVLEAIRDHSSISALELAVAAMTDKGFPETVRQVRREFVSRFTKTLQNQVRRGTIERIGNGRGVRFKVAEPAPNLL
jgi:hypothetical protein